MRTLDSCTQLPGSRSTALLAESLFDLRRRPHGDITDALVPDCDHTGVSHRVKLDGTFPGPDQPSSHHSASLARRPTGHTRAPGASAASASRVLKNDPRLQAAGFAPSRIAWERRSRWLRHQTPVDCNAGLARLPFFITLLDTATGGKWPVPNGPTSMSGRRIDVEVNMVEGELPGRSAYFASGWAPSEVGSDRCSSP